MQPHVGSHETPWARLGLLCKVSPASLLQRRYTVVAISLYCIVGPRYRSISKSHTRAKRTTSRRITVPIFRVLNYQFLARAAGETAMVRNTMHATKLTPTFVIFRAVYGRLYIHHISCFVRYKNIHTEWQPTNTSMFCLTYCSHYPN